MENNRFELVSKESWSLTANEEHWVIKDKHTGVLYYYIVGGHGRGGITPLLDTNGKPLVEK